MNTPLGGVDIGSGRHRNNEAAAGQTRQAGLDGLRPWTLAVIPLILLAIVSALRVNRTLYYWLVGEDGILEWGQFGAYVATAALSSALLPHYKGRTDRVLLVIAVLAMVVVAGEEIAWGQRVFGVHVESIVAANDQGDLTLHNIGGGLRVSQIAFLALSAVGLVLPLLPRMQLPMPAVVRGIVAPPWLLSWFGLGAVYTSLRLAQSHPLPGMVKASEVAEATVAVGLVTVAFLTYRAATVGRAGRVSAATRGAS